jgi:Zn-dependent peptidase ImmA (M78 family)/transcriptional regulator with XRE-family HTH domain
MSGHYDLEETQPLFSGSRLRLAREARAMTQKELAEQVKISPAAMSQFERGDAKPTEATLFRLASTLRFPTKFFSSSTVLAADSDDALKLADGFGHFRSLRSMTATQRRQALSVTHLVRDVVGVLERDVRLPARDIPRRDDDDDHPHAIEDWAGELRRRWHVPDGPIEDALRLMERHGIVAARRGINVKTMSAYSVPFAAHPVVMLSRERAKRDRDRFSVSHELAHLTMHRVGNTLAEKVVELQADIFAAAFLMPAEQIRSELPAKVDWPRLLKLKAKWQVSLAALLRRALTLHVMSEGTYTSAMRTMGTRGWRTDEPGALGPPEAPAALVRASAIAWLSGADLSEETGWPRELIDDLMVASADSRPELDF